MALYNLDLKYCITILLVSRLANTGSQACVKDMVMHVHIGQYSAPMKLHAEQQHLGHPPTKVLS